MRSTIAVVLSTPVTSLAEMSGSSAPVPSSSRDARVQVVRLLDKSRALLRTLGPSDAEEPARGSGAREAASRPGAEARNSVQDNVENDPGPAEKSPVEGILLIEGLKPGAHLDS